MKYKRIYNWLFEIYVSNMKLSYFFKIIICALVVFSPAVPATSSLYGVFSLQGATIESRGICDHGNAWGERNGNIFLDGSLGSNSSLECNPNEYNLYPYQVTATFDDTYVPVEGDYFVDLFICDSSNCKSLANTQVYDHMVTTIPWTHQIVQSQFGSITTKVFDSAQKVNYTFCLALHSKTGEIYTIKTTLACTDGTPTPPTPPPTITCKFADGATLNVDMGQIDRSSLPVTPNTGTNQVSKSIDVSCDGTDSLTTEMSVSYTPITVNGTEVDKTSSNGVGVTVLLDGQPVGNNAKFAKSFTPGDNKLDFAFEAVRDPAVPVADIATGAFTANAIVTITPQ
jgi:type 1 fimbria pilin